MNTRGFIRTLRWLFGFLLLGSLAFPPARVSAADLSLSSIRSRVTRIGETDMVVYTAILHNSGEVSAANLTFTSSIPPETAFLAGTAFASDEGPVTFISAASAITWTGAVAPGCPVWITYTLTVTPQLPGTSILLHTSAMLSTQPPVTFSDDLRYVPGYALALNGGALAARTALVDLTFTFDPLDGYAAYRLSSDPTFSAAEQTSAWLELSASPQTYSGWALDPTGDPRLPRTVYLQLRKPGGELSETFSAAILSDAQPPGQPAILQLPQPASVSPARVVFAPASAAPRAVLQWLVTNSDDNSGVEQLQLSQAADFTALVFEIPVTVKTILLHVELNTPGPIYLRALDRAGNLSPLTVHPGIQVLYLPQVFHK